MVIPIWPETILGTFPHRHSSLTNDSFRARSHPQAPDTMAVMCQGGFVTKQKNASNMKSKIILTGLLAAALSAMTASANVLVTVACPLGNSAAGINVCATLSTDSSQFVCGQTDANGFVKLFVPVIPGTYHVCVDVSTLPPGATLSRNCQDVIFTENAELPAEFVLEGTFCSAPPPSGPCWETGGGTLAKVHGKPMWSFGGVIYPGCSPTAAGGGNLNVVNHFTGLHFKGEEIVVDGCRGVRTRSPKVTVNIIDFHGIGEVSGIAGNSTGTINVTFEGTFRDSHDGGAGKDGLYLQVTAVGGGIIPDFSIGNDPNDLERLSTGNVQIHQSSCGK